MARSQGYVIGMQGTFADIIEEYMGAWGNVGYGRSQLPPIVFDFFASKKIPPEIIAKPKIRSMHVIHNLHSRDFWFMQKISGVHFFQLSQNYAWKRHRLFQMYYGMVPGSSSALVARRS